MARWPYPTLLDLVQVVSEVAASDQETLAAVADLINSGQVRLRRAPAGATIDLAAMEDVATWGSRADGCASLTMLAPRGAQQRIEALGMLVC